MSGPLTGFRVVEVAGVGPGPFAAMMLADMGAEVLRLDRAQAAVADHTPYSRFDLLNRGRRSVAVDLKTPEGVELVLRLVGEADGLIEGFRPGVAERLGIGPDTCLARNPRLVYGRMTGWGQDGPYAAEPGHDINYIALSGVLSGIGRKGEPPVPPLNLVGDFGGGGMLLAFGLVCGLLEASRSGQGQVIDAAMIDGSALLATMIHGFTAAGTWGERGTNVLDSGAWFYDTYECADGGYISLGSLEGQFYAQLVKLSGLADDVDGTGPLPEMQMDRETWPAMKERMAALIRTRTRDEWCALLEGGEVCFAPVLSMQEAPHHPHHVARQGFTEVDGIWHASPAPRFSRTPGAITSPPPYAGQHTDEALTDWGVTAEELSALRSAGAVR